MKIDKDKKIPKASSGRKTKYPFKRMSIGDSFKVLAKDSGKVRLAASAWKRRHEGWDYVTRSTGKGKFVRIWRVS